MPETTIAGIALLIAERALCRKCVCSKIGLTDRDFGDYLQRICRAIITVYDQIGRCSACEQITTVFSLVSS